MYFKFTALTSCFLFLISVQCDKITIVEFLISGKVEGVDFRKYAELAAQKFRVRGYIMNTDRGYLVGVLDGHEGEVNKMKQWLLTEGSPRSRIDTVIFRAERKKPSHMFKDFSVRRLELMGDEALKIWEYELRTRNITGTKSPCGHLANRTFTKFMRIITYKPIKYMPRIPRQIKKVLRARVKLKKILSSTTQFPEYNFTASNETSYFSSYEWNRDRVV